MKKLQSFVHGAKQIIPGVILIGFGIGFIVGALMLSHWVGEVVKAKTNAGWGVLADWGTYISLAFVYIVFFDLLKVRLENGKWDFKSALKTGVRDFGRFLKLFVKVVVVVGAIIGICYLGFKIFVAGGILVLLLAVIIAILIAILVFVILIFAMVW
mgnify:CR=1 FL=1